MKRLFEWASDNTASVLMFIMLALTVMAFVLHFIVTMGSMWTGSGVVVDRSYAPETESGYMAPVSPAHGVYMWQDTSQSERFFLTIRDDAGEDHTVRVSESEYNNAEVGEVFVND